jgi:predicted RNA polymerase sigma factor
VTDGVRRRVEDLLRELAPQVLGTLTGRYGQFDACEDATQEALLKAAQHWPEDGIPHSPRGWLLTVASRVLVDEFRSDSSRRRREDAVIAATPQSELLGRPADSIADPGEAAADHDDSLKLLFLCCHPSLRSPSETQPGAQGQPGNRRNRSSHWHGQWQETGSPSHPTTT